MFLSRCFTKVELRYGSIELEVVCFVWIYKRLYILLYFNNRHIVVFIDYDAICGIVNSTILNTISTDRANCRLTNVLVYLSIYPLDVYYISRRLNLVLDTLSRLQVSGDDVVRQNEEVEPVLNDIWDPVFFIYIEV
jgi:hypothetical protein